MADVSLFRLYALRAVYLLIAVGLASTIWPLLLNHSPTWPLMNGVVCSLLAGVSVLAAVGIRYPLQMLPVLLFELVWKSIWLMTVALPLWSANAIDARAMETVRDCVLAVVLIPLIPWRYVLTNYVRKPGDRWRRVDRRETILAPALRISSTGLGQSTGTGLSVSSIRKSPFGSSGTVDDVLCSTKGAAVSQIKVANTD